MRGSSSSFDSDGQGKKVRMEGRARFDPLIMTLEDVSLTRTRLAPFLRVARVSPRLTQMQPCRQMEGGQDHAI